MSVVRFCRRNGTVNWPLAEAGDRKDLLRLALREADKTVAPHKHASTHVGLKGRVSAGPGIDGDKVSDDGCFPLSLVTLFGSLWSQGGME